MQRKCFCDMWWRKFINKTSKVQIMKLKLGEFDCIQIKDVCSAKNIMDKTDRWTEWKSYL